MADDLERFRLGAGAAVSTLIGGGIGALFGQKTGALIGAAVASGVTGGIPFMFCGMLASEAERVEIDRIQRPKMAGMMAGSVAAALAGGALGSKVSKAHSTMGAVLGSALANGVAMTVVAPCGDCPKLSELPQSGVGALRSEWGIK